MGPGLSSPLYPEGSVSATFLVPSAEAQARRVLPDRYQLSAYLLKGQQKPRS